ncbi:MAG TPA: MFS transporter, partial [Rhodospirillaceae bacterium]|nr:MFS transporter [Rhodospirillaceae bacterium]
SSFIGAVTTALAAFLGWMVGQAYDGSTLPISIGFACFGAAALAVTFITEGGRLFNSETGNIR